MNATPTMAPEAKQSAADGPVAGPVARPGGAGLAWFGLAVAIAAAGADRLSKWWLLDVFDLPNRPPVHVTDFFNLVMVWNRGVSFGLLAGDAGWHRLMLAGFAVLVSAVLGFFLFRSRSRWIAGALGLVIGGALSNAWDRLTYGAVADFLDFHVGGYHWYAFNIADAAITVGAAMLVLDGLFGGQREPAPAEKGE